MYVPVTIHIYRRIIKHIKKEWMSAYEKFVKREPDNMRK